jgi:hypothetical protein
MRRSVYDQLEPTSEPRWYVVRNMHRAVIAPLEVAADPETHTLTVATIALAALTGCLFVATGCMARVGAKQHEYSDAKP